MSSHNTVISLDGKFEIYVPACTPEWANVSVSYVNRLAHWRWGNRSVQRKLDLKTFVLAKGELPVTHPGAMPMREYLDVLQANKEIILQLCRRLNSV